MENNNFKKELVGINNVRLYSWNGGSLYNSDTSDSCSLGVQTLTDYDYEKEEVIILGYVPTRTYIGLTPVDLPVNPRIKKAELKLYLGYTYLDGEDVNLGLYGLSEAITEGNNVTPAESHLIDYVKLYDGSERSYTFDITSFMRELALNPGEGKGLCLRFMKEDFQKTCSSSVYNYCTSSGSHTYAPVLTIEYESSYGVNTSHPSHTHDLGRFGQGSIDLQTGNLMFSCEDFTWNGNRMPIDIKHYYNSAISDVFYHYDSTKGLFAGEYGYMKLGFGWKLNMMCAVDSYVEDGREAEYCFLTENGEQILFKKKESDSSSTLYEDKLGLGYVFDSADFTLKCGDVTYNFNGTASYTMTDGKNTVNVNSENYYAISSATDGVGRSFDFTYDENLFLTKITAPDESEIRYSYTDGLLTGITYPDGTEAVIEYNSTKPQSVTLKDNTGAETYKVEYTFDGNQLKSVTEKGVENGQYVTGASANYTYYGYKTVVETVTPFDSEEGETENHTITTVYTFDNEGNTIGEYIYDEALGNMGIGGGSEGINPYSDNAMINIKNYNNNFLVNHAFYSVGSLAGWESTGEESGDWYTSVYNHPDNTEFGKYRMRIYSGNTECTDEGRYHTTDILPKATYTFSAYAIVDSTFTGDDTKGAYLRVVDDNGTILSESQHLCEKSDTYTRLATTFTITEPQSVTVQLFANGKGAVYFNAPQLENNQSPTAYNMLENGSFENMSGWTINENSQITDSESFERGNALKMTGDIFEQRQVSQKVYVLTPRTVRENFTLSGWAKGCALLSYTRDGIEVLPEFRLRAVVHYNDSAYGETECETYTADFVPDNLNWQFASVQFSKEKYRVVDYIEIFCDYDYNANEVYFDNIQLTRDSLETDLTAEDFAIIEDEPEIDEGYEVETETDEETEQEVGFEELKDDFDNILTETTFTDGEFGTVYRSFEYDENGNNLTIETDARGNKTVYTVDPVTSRNIAITDRCGNKTAYEYDAMGKIVKVISQRADGTEVADVSYTYDGLDNMTQISRGDGFKYSIGYNAFSKLESIGIVGKAENLVKYNYKTGNGRLKQINYANGDYIHITYNGLGQVIAEKWYDIEENLTAHYKYSYDSEGNVIRLIDILGNFEYNYKYKEGVIECTNEYKIEIADEIVTSKTLLNTIQYSYDSEGALFNKSITFADGTEQVTDYENPEDGNVIAKLSVNGKTVISHSKEDSFGRTEFEELQLAAGVVSRRFEYLAGKATDEHIESEKLKSTPTTHLVSRITLSDGRILCYEYDEEERITKVIDSITGVTEYAYDELGQLLTETVNGTVINQITYDNYGNILVKDGKVYSYDAVWKDLLTGVGKETITYDAQGNPTNYLGHTLAWEKGRQLKSFDNIQYTYNANGIRNSKTVDGIRHTFVLEDVKILKETYGSHTIETLYDNEDSVCGIIYNGTPYYFLKNLQGDIISITDHTGTVVANYSYDAWGKVLSISGDNIHIGAVNPYRYRGYYYDSEINMYYLQSRYYDPEVGRFVCEDDVYYLGANDSLIGYNLMTYCDNDPVCFCDYFGSYIMYIYGKSLEKVAKANIKALKLKYLVRSYCVNSDSGFAKVWNTKGKNWLGQLSKIDIVIVESHGSVKKVDYVNFKKLRSRKIDTLILSSCNAGHLDYISTNPATKFYMNNRIRQLVCCDGTHYITLKTTKIKRYPKISNWPRYIEICNVTSMQVKGDDAFRDFCRSPRPSKGYIVYAGKTKKGRIKYYSIGHKFNTMVELLKRIGK